LGALIKKQGPIWLGLTRRSVSIRPYSNWREIGMMIARSAYAQLRYNPLMLVGTVLGLALMFGAPVWLALMARGSVQVMGLIALGLMLGSYQPILGFYGRAPMRALALPLVALFYVSCTIYSAWAYYRGKGGMWKGRAQALDVSGGISGHDRHFPDHRRSAKRQGSHGREFPRGQFSGAPRLPRAGDGLLPFCPCGGRYCRSPHRAACGKAAPAGPDACRP
jgi:hypothetical protein